MIDKAKKLDMFEKYEHFTDLNMRREFEKGKEEYRKPELEYKPTGKYEINPEKKNYTKTSFWTIEETPDCPQETKKEDKAIMCPGSNHKLTFKKLRSIIIKTVGE